MLKKLTTIAAVIAVTSIFGSSAYALGLNDPGVVGAIHGALANSNVDTETAAAEFLLDMATNTTDSNGPGAGAAACNISTDAGCYATSNTDYSGDLSGGAQGAAGDVTVDAGFEYALAKYDGPNGGYVLFYLGGAATTLPNPSSPLWGEGGQYGLSHYTTFNATSVPEPSTLLLLGGGLVGLGFVRRLAARRRRS